MIDPLNAVAVRVLGSLMEKEVTTPDNYPLTLNALTGACNQTSNRDPVMSLDEVDVQRSLDGLAARGFARALHRSDSRVLRYRQTLSEALHLHAPEAAVMCVLMLRGPQTAGEIRTRTGRLFEFRDVPHVEVTLQSLASLSDPLVVQLPRQPGQKEQRYAHLLSGEPVFAEAGPTSHESPSSPARDRIAALEDAVAELRTELATVREELEAFKRQF
ncbi:MAG TPA: YceH family protein [Longimicrobiales bacterium]